MAVTATIGGVAKAYRIGSLRISSPVSGRQTASLEVRSNDGTYRPALDATVVIADGATVLFGGLIDSPEEEGTLGDESGGYDAISTRINAVSYHAYTERRFVNETLAAGTLKSMLTTLVANYLAVAPLSVTLSGGQVNGPTLPALTYEYTRLSDVLNELMTLTGKYGNPYVWTINGSKVLSAYQPSSAAAPFNITDGDGNTIGDITVDRTRHDYANTIILRVPAKTELQHVETFTGDGVTDTFTLQYSIIQAWRMGNTDTVGGYDTLTLDPAFAGSATWTYDPVTNTLTNEDGAPSNGSTLSLTFDGQFDGTATATDAGDVASYGPWERVITVDSVPADTTAQALADGYLAKALASPKVITYRTFVDGLDVGQTQTITCTPRNLSAVSCVVTEVTTRDYGTGSNGSRGGLIYDVTVTSGVNPQDQWRDIYKLWAGDRTGGALAASPVSVGAGAPGPAGGPSPPPHAVQTYVEGAFHGEAEFIYYEDENSLICGGGGCSITAVDFESCQVFGYDNHITDP